MLKITFYNLVLALVSAHIVNQYSAGAEGPGWAATIVWGRGQASVQVVPDHVLNLPEQGVLTRNWYRFRQQKNNFLLSDDQNLNNSSCT